VGGGKFFLRTKFVNWRRSGWISILCGRLTASNLHHPWSGASSVRPGKASFAQIIDWLRPQSRLDSRFSRFRGALRIHTETTIQQRMSTVLEQIPRAMYRLDSLIPSDFPPK
jgi:hypothetical protein